MKTKNYITIVLIAVAVFCANTGRAAFAIKKGAAKTEVVTESSKSGTPAADETTAAASSDVTTAAKVETRKASFVSRLLHKIGRAKNAAIPKVAYIILAIIGFGWLAMGINDSFGDFDWVLSLILYIIFYLPGLIYTLIKMKKYY